MVKILGKLAKVTVGNAAVPIAAFIREATIPLKVSYTFISTGFSPSSNFTFSKSLIIFCSSSLSILLSNFDTVFIVSDIDSAKVFLLSRILSTPLNKPNRKQANAVNTGAIIIPKGKTENNKAFKLGPISSVFL